QLLAWIVEELGQAERRIGEIQSAVGAVDQIVGAVEALAFVAVGQNRDDAVLLETHDAPASVLVDGEPAVAIEREPIGAGLAVLGDVGSRVAALGAKDRDAAVGRPAIDRVGVGVAEEQIAAIAHPHRALSEQKPVGQLLDFGAGWNN